MVEVLKEIRDEVKATNGRLDQTNSGLASLEGRVETGLTSLGKRIDKTNARLENVESRLRFVEKRLKNGLAEVSQKIETVAKKQLQAEMHVVTELVSVAALLRLGMTRRQDDQKSMRALEKRVTALEKRRR